MPGTEPTLYASPLQGFTDFRFRSAFQEYFGGIDQYFAPYIRLQKGQIKASNKRDILQENNQKIKLVPQLMTKDVEEFLSIAAYVRELGYGEVNWNLGCPYPMVTKRGMGSGMLNAPEKIDEIMSEVFARSDIRISVKMRLGYEKPDEILSILPLLDKHPLENICIHPRIGTQIYKGGVNLEGFEACLGLTKHRILYNGDIKSVQDFRSMKKRFPQIEHWMIGRGLIVDPFLPSMIKMNCLEYPADARERFSDFHDTLLASYSEALSGQKHILLRMYQFWVYFIQLFPGAPKGLKKIKKAQNLEVYRAEVKNILRSGL